MCYPSVGTGQEQGSVQSGPYWQAQGGKLQGKPGGQTKERERAAKSQSTEADAEQKVSVEGGR